MRRPTVLPGAWPGWILHANHGWQGHRRDAGAGLLAADTEAPQASIRQGETRARLPAQRVTGSATGTAG